MKKTRKIAVLLTCMTMTATVLTPALTVYAEEEVTGKVELWNDKLGGAEVGVPDAIAQAANDLSGVELIINSYSDVAAYQAAFQQSIREPEAPGLFTWWGGKQLEALVEEGLVEDLTDIWEEYLIPAGVPESVAESFTYDGKIYAAPYDSYYHSVFYNVDCFEQAGITKAPETFDEFLDACAKLKEAGITPIGVKNDSWASFYWFTQLVAGYEPQLYEDICSGAREYTDPDVKKVMEIWKDMIDKGYFADPVAYMDLEKNVATGKAAMYLELYNEPVFLARDYGTVSGEDIDAFPLPSINGGKKVVFYVASPLCIASASADKGSAKKVLETWYSEEIQSIFVNDMGITNTTIIESEDPTICKIVKEATDTENFETHLRYYENTPAELRDYACDELSRFMYSGADIDEVLGNIQAKADETFGK